MESEETPKTEEKESKQGSYNKRPVWQWVAIYAVIGLVVYGLVYYFVLSKRQGKYSYPSNSQNYNYSQSSPTPSVPPVTGITEKKETQITLTKSGFNPQSVTIKAGTKVVWTNQSGETATVNSAVHPTHQVYPPLNLGTFANGQSLSLVFNKPGTYKYHNHLNASETGTIIVE